jgi:hypothetical protein
VFPVLFVRRLLDPFQQARSWDMQERSSEQLPMPFNHLHVTSRERELWLE